MEFLELFDTTAEGAEKVEFAWDVGHAIGEFLNDHFVQPLFDEHQAGTGHLGDEYIHLVNETGFDPMHPLDSLHVNETEHHDPLHHDADHHYDPGGTNDTYDSADHHDYSDHNEDYSN